MKKISFNPVRYIFCGILFLLLFCSTSNYCPITIALVTAFIYAGYNKAIILILSQLALFYNFNPSNFLINFISSSIITAFFTFYKKNKKPKFELMLYLIVSLLPYLIFGGITTTKAVYTAIILPFCFISIVAIRVLFVNKFRYKISQDEIFSVSIFTCFISIGFISIFGQELFKAFAVWTILFACHTLGASGTLVAFILSVPLCITTSSFNPVGVFALYSIACQVCSNYSRLLSSVLVLGVEMLLVYATTIYPTYSLIGIGEFIFALFAFAFLPKKLVENIKDNFYKFKEKKLPRIAINRSRLTLSASLYEVSCAFAEMYSSISSIKNCTMGEEQIKQHIAKSVLQEVCYTCPLVQTCQMKNFPTQELMIKLASIGLARGKLTLIDLPVEFTRNCSFSNNILYSFNEQISGYSQMIKQNKAFCDETELLGLQTSSIASVLKEFACDYSKTLNFAPESERAIYKALHHSGIKVNEIMVFGEGENCEINISIDKEEYDAKNLSLAVSQGIGFSVTPVKVINLSQTHLAVCYKIAPPLDAVFGIAQQAKDGVCGDTHSLIKLGSGKFVVAINDGMGSGKKANHISSVATSLLESFFKAGLNGNLALKTVNKVLAVTSTDTFTALDLAIIDLYKGYGEFIKIGSPYGYVIEKDNIKIIEANSLPMGITDEMLFSPATTTLNSGDMILLVSDGVSDAFGSSTDILEYLKSVNIKNPQKLADSIIEKATALDGYPKDDMTALCVRLYKKDLYKPA